LNADLIIVPLPDFVLQRKHQHLQNNLCNLQSSSTPLWQAKS